MHLMALVEEYYELNEAEEISAFWKIIQILSYGLAGGFGLWCGFTLSNLRLTFHDRCYLFTDVKISPEDGLKMDYRNINWESDMCCDYFQFSMISSFIVAIIWGALFLMCGKGGKSLTGLPQPWRIVWPSFVFNFIYFIVILSNAIYIQRGTNIFCKSTVHDKNSTRSHVEHCNVLSVLLRKDFKLTEFHIKVVAKTSWSSAFFWFILFLIPLFRIIFAIDFRMYKIRVFRLDDTTQSKKEEVLKITNYEEPKHIISGKEFKSKSNVDFEKKPTSTELRGKKKLNLDKTHQKVDTISLTPFVTQNILYETADIRMLRREKKMRKLPKALDEGFGGIISGFGGDLGNSFKILSNSEVSSYSEMPTYRHPRRFYSDEEEYSNPTSLSSNTTPTFNEEENESPCGSEILVCDFGSNRFLRVKKEI